MNKKVIIIIICVLIIAFVIGIIIAISTNNEQKEEKPLNKPTEQIEEQNDKAPSRIDDNEKDVSKKKAKELFNFIPKVYSEAVAPFKSLFMLDAVMQKIIDTNENQDFSVGNVDKMVTKIFGKDSTINKAEVSEPNVEKSLFYYSEEADSYAVIPVGYEGIYKYQILKNATETEEAYYVYTYTLIGGYSYDENSITEDEFGDVSYENARVQLIVGDKDGRDLVHVFDNYTKLYDEEIWLSKYSNIMPIYRYTLKKSDNGYYLTEVEQINY